MRQNLLIVSMVLLFVIIIIWVGTQFLRLPTADTPKWNGITPSQTTREEVIVILGKPDETWTCLRPNDEIDILRYERECERTSDVVNYGYYQEQLPGKPHGWHEIYFNLNNTVDYVVETRWTEPNGESKEAFLLRHGSPERVTWSHRGVRIRGLLYCEQGLIFHVVLEGDRGVGIREAVYFTPMPTNQCIDKFFNEIATTNPYEGSDVEGSLDPWGFNGTKP